jgi:hypothetical protein
MARAGVFWDTSADPANFQTLRSRTPMNDRIALLMPTRNRPERMIRALKSIRDLATAPAKVVVVVGVDCDDSTTQSAALPAMGGVEVRRIVGPRLLTLGHLWNKLADNATGCDILAMSVDDYVMATPGWDAVYRQAAALMPCGFGVAWPRDPIHHPYICTHPVTTRAMMERMGFFVPPWFPFWFLDTWLEEVGVFSACGLRMNVQLGAPDGRGDTQGMRDLAFWTHFFEALRPARQRLAEAILHETYADQPGLLASLMLNVGLLPAYYTQRIRALYDPAYEAHVRGTTGNSVPSARYLEAKAQAEQYLTSLSLPLSPGKPASARP